MKFIISIANQFCTSLDFRYRSDLRAIRKSVFTDLDLLSWEQQLVCLTICRKHIQNGLTGVAFASQFHLLMLNGLSATSFPSSTYLALGTDVQI